jgi:hypothetical protein
MNSCFHGSEDISLIDFAYKILEYTLNFAGEYEGPSLTNSNSPITYILYEKNYLTEEFYSNDYWVNVEGYLPTMSNDQYMLYDGLYYIFIYILPRSNNEFIYLTTNFNTDGPYYELREYPTNSLLELINSNRSGNIDNNIIYNVICRYWWTDFKNHEIDEDIVNIYLSETNSVQ